MDRTRIWAAATRPLQDACLATGLGLVPDPGGAAFTGPRCQFRSGCDRTLAIIHYPVRLQRQPERFDLEYTAADGTRQRPS